MGQELCVRAQMSFQGAPNSLLPRTNSTREGTISALREFDIRTSPTSVDITVCIPVAMIGIKWCNQIRIYRHLSPVIALGLDTKFDLQLDPSELF